MIATFLTFFQSITRDKRYVTINITGLALGFATFLTLGLIVRYDTTYEAWIPDAGRIMRLDTRYTYDGQTVEGNGAAGRMAPLMAQAYPVPAMARSQTAPVQILQGDRDSPVQANFVDPQFFLVFNLKFRYGDRAHAFLGPQDVVLSSAFARRFFGRGDVVGRTLSIRYKDRLKDYRVTGVLAPMPGNTELSLDLLMEMPKNAADQPFVNEWYYFTTHLYMRLRAASEAPAVAKAARIAMERADPDDNGRTSFNSVLMRDTHFRNISYGYPGDSRAVVTCLGLIGLFALLAACVNSINLAASVAISRAREIAMRKVLGATRRALVARFIAESMVFATLGGAFGLVISEIVVPIIASSGGWTLRVDYGFVLPLLAALVPVVGLAVGLYPALMMSSFGAAEVLVSARTPMMGRRGRAVRFALVTAQFIFAIAFAICTVVVDAQAHHLRTLDHGFASHDLLVAADAPPDAFMARQTALLAALRGMPGVRSASVSDAILDGNSMSRSYQSPGDPHLHLDLTEHATGQDYFRTYAIHLVAGRLFDAEQGADTATDFGNRDTRVVIDRAAAHALGFRRSQDAIGRSVMVLSHDPKKAHVIIIGVVDNVYFGSGHKFTGPQLYYRTDKPIAGGLVVARVAPGAGDDVFAALRSAWPGIAPGVPFTARRVDDILSAGTRPEWQRARLFTIGASVAIGIACLGLYGLAAFNVARRLHEVGIRKTLGATSAQVIVLMLLQFLRPIGLASLVACPIAWGIMRAWLVGFDQRIALSPLYFAVVVIGALLLCAGTVFGQTVRVARAEPARALRAS